MTTKAQQLADLQESILQNQVCKKMADESTQLVFGAGNPNADIVFIGEAPGKQEDIKGLPFIGASGKFLDEMLETISLKRRDIYITNIVKYRPLNNRDPSPEEKKEFLPYLQAQLEIIQPEVVITLGRHSMNCFLPNLQISQVHGTPKQISLQASKDTNKVLPLVILPLYHPAAALYNGKMRGTLLNDFAAIPALLKKKYI